jgi:hypothetical protein
MISLEIWGAVGGLEGRVTYTLSAMLCFLFRVFLEISSDGD